MLMKILRAVGAVIDWGEKRPWIPMAIYLGIFVLFVISSGLLLTNMIDSRWRPFSDFTKEEKAVICHVGDYIGWAVVAAGVFSVAVAPFMMLCVGRFRASFNMFVMGRDMPAALWQERICLPWEPELRLLSPPSQPLCLCRFLRLSQGCPAQVCLLSPLSHF